MAEQSTPPLPRKHPIKYFKQAEAPVEEEEEEEAERAATSPSSHSFNNKTPTGKGPGIGKGSRCQFKYSAKHHTDLPQSKDDAPPPLKKKTISSITSARKNEESTRAPHKQKPTKIAAPTNKLRKVQLPLMAYFT